MAPQPLAFGPFVLDLRRGVLLREGRPLAAGHRGLSLLHALLQAPGQVLPKDTLIQSAWPDVIVEESNLTVQIATLRKLLGPQADGSQWIATVPRVGYRFVGRVEALDADADVSSSGPVRTSNRDFPDPAAAASIVVLPLVNVGAETEQEYLADGITEDIITALTRFRWFRVIGRNTSFAYKDRSIDSRQVARELGVRYALEGSVRRSGRHLRISAQLVEAASAHQIWAERYEMELEDSLAVQDAIAERVAGAIEPELLKAESSWRASARSTGSVTARDAVRQGTWHFHHVARESHLKARALFRDACAQDPELAEAHIWVARVSAGIVAYGWSEAPQRDIGEGLDAATRAIRLDERNPYSHYALAICSPYAGEPERSVLAAQRAIELSPSFALGHLVLGMGHLFRGAADEAIPAFERGLALNRHDPQNFVWYDLLAHAHLFVGQAREGLRAALEARTVRPAWQPIHRTLACCYVALGEARLARECVQRMQELEKPPGDALGPLGIRCPQWIDQLEELLRSCS